MAGNTSKLKIISSALVLIGAAPINSLNDAGAGADTAEALYESSLENILTLHRWRFTMKQAQLSRSAEKPLYNWKYSFYLPNDYLFLEKTSSIDYDIIGDRLYSNDNNIFIEYGFRASESNFPAWFTKTLEYFLASEFAIPITGNATKAQFYAERFEKQFSRARYEDSVATPTNQLGQSPSMYPTISVRG